MRAFFRTHWKAIVAIAVLVLLAMFTMNPTAAGTLASSRLVQDALSDRASFEALAGARRG